MPTQAAFWDKTARKYAARPVSNVPNYEDTLTRARAYLHPQDKALEIGCGTGTTALKLAGNVGHLVGTDISPEMIAIGREKLADGGPGNVTFEVADVMDLPSTDDGYDAVLAFNVLHLIEDLPGAVSAIRDRLKPGGVMISKSVGVGEANWFLRNLMLPALTLLGKAPFVHVMRAKDFDGIIAGAGFEVLETHTYQGMAPTRLIIARKV
ncbi:MAG: class I SAM-dependent methyltransferase [Pseudomonadota bacterium]